MQNEITGLLNNQLISFAATHWSATGKIELLDNVANFVYQFQSGNQWKILRITHCSHRSEDEIVAELDWVNFLHNHGVPVARPYPSTNQRFTETFQV
ncbi:MAG: hypothetical protein KKB74_01580, partial [Bacteroidetes bacterium]|nr:hypothetical protein [Bacteroidota bacterium]